MSKKKPAVVSTRPNYDESQRMNDDYYWTWYSALYELSAATIHWEGMPVEVSRRAVNMWLMGNALVVFYWDSDYDKYFCVRATPSGEIDMYNNPTSYTAYGAGNYTKRLKASECVPIWLNYRRMSALPLIDLYARKLARFEKTIDVNLAQQMTPAFIECDETVRLSVETALQQVYSGEPAVVGTPAIASLMQAHYVTADAPYIVDKLWQDKLQCLHEFLTRMGIDNSPVDKMTRVQSAEVMSNNQEIEMFRLVRFDVIRECCAAVNRMYGQAEGTRPAVRLWADMNGDWSSGNFDYLNTVENFEEGGDNGAVELP